MTRSQVLRVTVSRLLQVFTVERHGGVDRDQLIILQQEDPTIEGLVDAKIARRGNKTASFEKIKDIVYRRFQERKIRMRPVILPTSLRGYVMSVAHVSIVGAHLVIRRTKDGVLSRFFWPGMDGDVTKYC
ncbi:reverse transcriptase [Plakobranchus ocellatus]|uniref:Reverse transcriptase n=1 Tax=Plakobranchus ocellatus TaxID=259542 RepID=A0AAV3YI36_9GAST|nr:reverse transcriptase [Plakobranchus ocellatus]